MLIGPPGEATEGRSTLDPLTMTIWGEIEMKRVALLLAPLLLSSSAVLAATADTCLNCHEPDEIKDKSVEEAAAALADAGNKNHRRVKDLSAEEIEAILKELQGG